MKRYLLLLGGLLTGILTFAQHKINDFEIPALSQVPFSIAGVSEPEISLNGKWSFSIQGAQRKSDIAVPGEWEMQGFSVNEGETAVYSRILNIPNDWRGKKVKIKFDAVSSHALIKVNGKVVGEHEGSFVPFEVDISPALTYNDDILEAEVQSLTISDRLACTSQYACHTVGGLLRKVTLFVVPETSIENTTATITFDKQYKNAVMHLHTSIESASNNSTQVRYTLEDATGKKVLQKIGSNSNNEVQVKQPQQWNPEHPYLYNLTTELLVNGKTVQTNKQKIGFRQIEIKGNEFWVNGKPVKLHGVNRHSVYPLTGRSISPQLDRKDAELFRAANCNYIRTSHYPPSEEFLNAADELGLFVESESSLCWIEHGASPIWRNWKYEDEKYLPYMIRANADNVLAGRNHPSVIIWSLGNESRWSILWEKVFAAVKQLDPSRPVSFHDQCWGGFNNAGSHTDIANYHYPGLNGPSATDTMKRPTLFGEYAHLSTYNRKELLTDPGIRSSYNAPLVQFYDSIYTHKGNLGGAIWSGIDDIFHMPDGRIVGYGPWGPIDAWRREKPEYFGVKKAYSPVKIKQVNWNNITKGYIEVIAENRYDFTSFRDVKIKAMVNGVEQTIQSSIASHSSGIIKIPSVVDARELYISFTDPRGFICAEEKFVREEKTEQLPTVNQVNLSVTENAAAYIVTQGDVEFFISKQSGMVLSAKKKGETVLQKGPALAIMGMNSDDGGKPNVAGETYQNNIYPLKTYPLIPLFAQNIEVEKTSEIIKLKVDITYNDANGKQTYLFTNKGQFITEYELNYTGEDTIPYQYGLLLQLSKTFDGLSWKRKGEFTIYPANHIGRNEGTAKLKARKKTGVEEHGIVPQNDWKDDATEMGSNDFRSTKRNIVQASLQNNKGISVKVFSDGTQSSRSWLQDENVNWLIVDYCNNGSEPFYGSPHSNGRIKIKNKTLKGKVVLEIK